MAQPILWAGVDAGKAAHHCVAIDADGERVLSRRVVNDEAALTDLIRAVKQLADGGSVRWAIDLNSGGAALLITLLLDDGQDLLYIPPSRPYPTIASRLSVTGRVFAERLAATHSEPSIG